MPGFDADAAGVPEAPVAKVVWFPTRVSGRAPYWVGSEDEVVASALSMAKDLCDVIEEKAHMRDGNAA